MIQCYIIDGIYENYNIFQKENCYKNIINMKNNREEKMATNNKSDFRNSSKIIFKFKSSRNHFENYKKYKEIDLEKAQNELDTAGVELYQVFEWSLKNYLYRRYQELATNNKLTQHEATKKIRGLLYGRIYFKGNKINVDTTYLSSEMENYADPTIDYKSFNIIKNNRYKVTNSCKHNAENVNPTLYEQSFKEIKQIILKYIDSNAPIQKHETPEYGKLQAANGYWKQGAQFDLALVVDDVDTLSPDELKYIAAIPWKIVFDFNVNSLTNGLEKAYETLYGYQPLFF